MLLRFVALLAVAAAVFVLVNAAQPIVEQNRKVRDWPAVDVTVAAKVIDVAPATMPATTMPSTQAAATVSTTSPATRAVVMAAAPPASRDAAVLIRYRHQVGDTIHQSFRRRALGDKFEGRALLEPALSTKGVASYQTRGYYDPAKPQEAFLPQPFGVKTYLPIFAAAPLLGMGFGALVMHKRARGGARVARPLADAEKGWTRLTPASVLPRHRAAGAWGAAVVCAAVAGFALYDYFAATPRTHSTVADALAWLAVAPGVVVFVTAMYLSRVARRRGEPSRAWVNEMPVKPGERFAVKCEVPVDPGAADVERSVVVTVTCPNRGKTLWEERAERSITGRGRQDGRATFEQRFTIPKDVVSRDAADDRPARIDGEVRIDGAVFLLPVLSVAPER